MAYEENFREFLKASNSEEQQAEEMDNNSFEKFVEEKPSTVKLFTKKNSESKEEIWYTFQDMPPSSKESLKIIYHKPVYQLPIPINPKYKKLTIAERAKLLDNYQMKIAEFKMRMAKKSLHRAPYSKPILPSSKCKNSLVKSADQDEDETVEDSLDQIPVQDFYVSQKGRQVKRKIYTEEIDNDDSDSDFALSIKKNKSAIDSDTKLTLDIPYTPEERKEKENHHSENNSPKLAKTRKDTPRRLPKMKKLSRSEEMFEKLQQGSEKAQQKQQEIVIFEKSLKPVYESEEEKLFADDSPTKETAQAENDENFIRRRVVPPLPTKKTSKLKKQITAEDFNKIDIVPSTPPDSPVKQYTTSKRGGNARRNQTRTKSKENLLNDENSEVNKRDCPICGKQFPQSEIEDHAASCENFEVDADEFEEKNKGNSGKITCELCDRVFSANKDCEMHMKQCIAGRVTDL